MNKIFKLKKGSQGLKVVSEIARSSTAGSRTNTLSVSGAKKGIVGTSSAKEIFGEKSELNPSDLHKEFMALTLKQSAKTYAKSVNDARDYKSSIDFNDSSKSDSIAITAVASLALLSPLAVSPAFAANPWNEGDRNDVTGGYSNASGQNNKVSGINSFASGKNNTASGEYSTVVGDSNKVSGLNSVSLGGRNNQSTAHNSATLGGEDNVAGGSNSATLGGQYNNAGGTYSATVGGYGNKATSKNAVAWGYTTFAGSMSADAAYLNQKYNPDGTLSLTETIKAACDDLLNSWNSCLRKTSLEDVIVMYNEEYSTAADPTPFQTNYGKGVSGKGENATSWGLETFAGNNQATAFGENSIANGENSTAFGKDSYAYADNSLAALGGKVGDINTAKNTHHSDTGVNSVAIGENAWVKSDNAFALGKDSLINTGSANSVAIGSFSKVGPDAENAFSAVGGHAKSSHSISIGVNSIANGVGSIAFGSGEKTGTNTNMSGSYANGNGAIAIGKKAEAGSATNIGVTGESGDLTLPQGNYSDEDGHHYSYARTMTGSGSQMIAIGDNASAYNDQAIAIGGNTAAIGYASISIGGDDIGLTGVRNDKTIKYLKDTLKSELETSGFTVSNTLDRTVQSNISQSNKPAFKDITLAQGASSIAFGFKSVAEGDLSNAFGTGARSIGLNSTAFGTFATAWGKESIAFGTATLTANKADYATAIGYMSQIGEGATNSVAVGYKNKVTGKNSTAVGQQNTVKGNNAGVFGDPSVNTADASYTFGNSNYVGKTSKNTDVNSIVRDGTTTDIFAFGSSNEVSLNGSSNHVHIVGTNNKGMEKLTNVGVVGNNNKIQNLTSSSVVGDSNTITSTKSNVFVLGNNVKTVENNSVFLGDSSAYTTGNTTAGATGSVTKATIGNGDKAVTYSGFAGATAKGVVSVGDKDKERRIQNVAAGLITKDSTDAINGSQLYAILPTYEADEDGNAKSVKIGDKTYKFSGDTATTPITADGGKAVVNNTYTSPDNKPLTKNSDGTYSNADGSPYTGDINDIKDSGDNPVTANDVRDTINNTYWNVSANNKTKQNIKASDSVKFVDGKGVAITQTDKNTNGEVQFKFDAKVDNKSVKIGDDGKISVKTDGNTINVTDNGIKVNTGSTTVNTDGTAKVKDGSDVNQVATIGDIVNTVNGMGWNVDASGNGDNDALAKLITASNKVELVGGTNVKIDQENTATGAKFTFNVELPEKEQLPVVYTKADGTKVVNQGGKWYEVKADGTPDTTKEVPANNIIASMNSGDNTTTNPVALNNVASHLDGANHTKNGSVTYAYPTTPNDNVLNQAATMQDVLNSGWNLKANGSNVDFVTHADTVNFISPKKSVTITSDSKDGVSNIKFDVNVDNKSVKIGDDGKISVKTDGDTINVTDNGIKVNTGSTTVNTDGTAKVKDGSDVNQVATIGDIVNTVNGMGWTAKDGHNTSSLITAGTEVTWEGGKYTDVVLDSTNNKFVVNSTLDIKQNGDTLTIKDGNTVLAEISQVTDTNTITKLTANNKEEAGETTGNIKLVDNGTGDNHEYDISLSDQIEIGGNDGKDGSIGVNGKDGKNGVTITADAEGGKIVVGQDGKDGVSITGKDGVGTIGLNGKDGKSADISVEKGVPGVNETDEKSRIVYVTEAGEKETIATMNDGLKFDGNYNDNNGKPIAKKLNEQLNIKGTHSAGKDKLSTGNIGVINNGTDLIIELAKDVDLGGDGSVKFGDNGTTVNNDGLTIANGPTITNSNVDMAGQQIHNVSAGIAGTDAVNVSQLKKYTAEASNTVSSGDNNIKVNPTQNQNGSTNYEVALNKDVTLDKGSITITGDTNNVNITGDKVDVGGNKIENVARGEAPTDAVNVSQLKELVGNYTVENYTDENGDVHNNVVQTVDENGKVVTLKTYNVKDQGEFVTNNVVTAISKMNEQGIKFFHTNEDESFNPEAEKYNTIDSSASGGLATAIGVQAKASGKQSLAIGNGAEATGTQSIAIGTGNKVSGNHSGAFGDPTIINGDNSYSVGNNNNIATNDTFVLGNNVTSTVADSIFLGSNTAYIANDNARTKGNAKGYNSATMTAKNAEGKDINIGMKKFAGGDQVVGVVSVGNGNQTRRIQNVAPGLISKDSTDAINGSQLYSAIEGVAEHIGAQTNNAINNLAKKLGDVRDEGRAGTASAIAIGNLPQTTMPGKGMLSVGAGYYKDEGALSVGLSKMSDNGKWILKSSVSVDTQENVGAGLSVGFHF